MARIDRTACLDAAAATARAIVADAVWHEQRCGWIGGMPEEGPGGTVAMTYQALGPDLYGGTAGVGLFLAEVAHCMDDAQAKATAAGALRHAASRRDALTGATRTGLYGGRYGIALALGYASRLLDDAELDEAARSATDALDDDACEEFDLVSGHAGAIIGLLTLRNLFGDDALVERAVVHGERLLEQAEAHDGTLSWRSPSIGSQRPLAGFSHGAAGAATALLELAAAAGDARFGDAAAKALEYEATLYDDEARNWPDLRESPAQVLGGAPVFVTFWCHGAPGIALSRMRAAELGAAGKTRDDAKIALDTTQAWVAAAIRSGANYSLCHGLAGNAEIIREGADITDADVDTVVTEVATVGIDSYLARSQRWPSGAHGAPTPSLFLGDAGVGRFYLRLAVPELPSLLLIRPEAFASPRP